MSEMDDRERDAYEQGKVDYFTKKLSNNSGDSEGTEELRCSDNEFTRDDGCDCEDCPDGDCCDCCPSKDCCPIRGIGFADILLSVADMNK